jgi:hypothetical protein
MRSFMSGLAVCAVALVATGAAPKVKEQPYEGKFECAIALTGAECTVAADKTIPAGRRLRIESVKARIVVPIATKSAFELFVDYGDPSAASGVGSIHAVPQQVGRTEGGFYNIFEVNEKAQAFAYRTAAYPAPKVRLSNPTSDPLKLQNGTIQDGVVSGVLVGLN